MTYEQLRNSLIPEAMQAAKRRVALLGKEYEDQENGRLGSYRHYFESEFFHQEMNFRIADALKAQRGETN
jgi:hypothetical protein